MHFSGLIPLFVTLVLMFSPERVSSAKMPFQRMEAENTDSGYGYGVYAVTCPSGETIFYQVLATTSVTYRCMFGDAEAQVVSLSVNGDYSGVLEVYVDDESEPIASFGVDPFKDGCDFYLYSKFFSKPLTGQHDISLSFTDGEGGSVNIDWLRFS